MTEFQDFLKQRLGHSLPGYSAQNKMRPRPSRDLGLEFEPHLPNGDDYRNSSVLAPVITWKDVYKRQAL